MESSEEAIPEDVLKLINYYKPKVDELFKKRNGKYHHSWNYDTSIRKMAESLGDDYLRLYDAYYSPMSEYHHWGTAAFAKRYRTKIDEVVEHCSDEANQERANAFLMALSSVISTIRLTAYILRDKNGLEKISFLAEKLKNLDGIIVGKNILKHQKLIKKDF